MSRLSSPDLMGYGIEPHGILMTNDDYVRALGYYNYHYTYDDAQKQVLEWMAGRYDQSQIVKISKINSQKIGIVCGAIARMINKDVIFPESGEQHLINKISNLLKSVDVELTVKKENAAFYKRIAIADKNSDVIAEIDGAIDDFLNGGYKSTFNFYELMKANDVKGKFLDSIVKKYSAIAEEIQLAIFKKDEELTTSYRNIHSMQGLRKFHDFLSLLIKDCSSIKAAEKNEKEIVKEDKRPRKVKQVSKVRSKALTVEYMKESPENKLVSLVPSKIVGAQQVWLYRVTQKAMVVLNAASPEGFTFKGATIQNIDEKTSYQKRMANLSAIHEISTGTKSKINKAMEIHPFTKSENPSGLVNKSTVIVRIF